MLAGRQGNDELLDERRHEFVAHHRAFILLDRQHAVWHLDGHAVLDLDLATQTPVVHLLLAREVGHLGGQNLAAALGHLYLALAATALAAAGTRQHHAVLVQGVQQGVAALDLQFLGAVIDVDFHFARGHEVVLGHEQQDHEQQREHEEHDGTRQNR